MTEKFFLRPGGVTAHLPISPHQRDILVTSVLSLYIPKTRTRLWPSSYIESLAEYLPNEGVLSVIVREAKIFACLPKTLALIDRIQDEFETRLRSRQIFTVDQTAVIFCVTRKTVGNWRDKGALVPVMSEALPMVNSKRGRPLGSFFSQAVLRQFGTWHFPRE